MNISCMKFSVLFLMSCLQLCILQSESLAATVNLSSKSAATAVDEGQQDGTFDSFAPFNLGSVTNNGWTSFRTALEFDISSIPAGATINSATLTLSVGWVDGTRQIALHGYAGRGTIELVDFSRDGLIGTTTLSPPGSQTVMFDVIQLIRGLAANHDAMAGFNIREDPANSSNYEFLNFNIGPDSPILSITYSESPDAGNSQLSGKVTDQSGAPLFGATISVLDMTTAVIMASGSTDLTGNYAVQVAAGTYNVRVTPPAGINFSPAVALARNVAGKTSLDFVLVPAGMTTLSGKLLDGRGNGIPSQNIMLYPLGSAPGMSTQTDSLGNYSFSISAGVYNLNIMGGINPALGYAAPQTYNLNISGLQLTQTTMFDIQLPVKRVDVHVQDLAGNSIAGVGMTVSGGGSSNLPIGPFTASGNASYWYSPGSTVPPAPPTGAVTGAGGSVSLWLFPVPPAPPSPPGMPPMVNGYTFTAIPPAGSGFAITSLSNVNVSNDMPLVITLESPTTLSGRLLDGRGIGIPNQSMSLYPSGGAPGMSTQTDSLGNYSFSISAGVYNLNIMGGINPALGYAAPQTYNLSISGLELTQTIVVDIQLPVKRVDVHVQDLAGNSVAGVGMTVSGGGSSNLPIGSFTASGNASYWYSPGSTVPPAPPTGAVTGADGSVSLWLFPVPPAPPSPPGMPPMAGGYTLTAIPPQGSPFATFSVQDVAVASDKSVVIVIQFVHDPPVTTVSLTPSPDALGNYADPVTASLSATATSGYSVATTYYNVDGGSTLTYNGPFTISGDGRHSLKYWSVDSVGVFEATKILSFIVVSDTIPPTTSLSVLPLPNDNGWNNTDVAIGVSATDNPGGSGVKQMNASLGGAQTGEYVLYINGQAITVSSEGATTVTYFSQDNLGNSESANTLTIRIDRTPPVILGLPPMGTTLWPPDGRFVQVATVTAADVLSGLSSFNLTVTSNEPSDPGNPDIIVTGNGLEPRVVQLRAQRLGTGSGRVYTLTATATDLAGNVFTTSATVTVPHDQGE